MLKVEPETGLLTEARFKPSHHCDHRPVNTSIDMIVIHGISLPPGNFGSTYIEDFFCGKLNLAAHPYFQRIATLTVSAHVLIDRQGIITQFVPFTKRAWHAGVSSFQQRTQCNDFSIGIELEGTDDLPYASIQYEQLAKLCRLLMFAYPNITRERIVGHCDVAPLRKTDPGLAFDWVKLAQLLEGNTL